MKTRLANAAVLILLAGTLSAAAVYERATRVPSDAALWAAVISEIVQKAPEEKLGPDLLILMAPKDYPAPPDMGQSPRGPDFSAQTKAEIQRLVTTDQPIRWVGEDHACRNPQPTNRFVAVGQIVDRGDHREVMTFDARGCLYASWATYRVVQEGKAWKVDGLVKPMSGMAPAIRPATQVAER